MYILFYKGPLHYFECLLDVTLRTDCLDNGDESVVAAT